MCVALHSLLLSAGCRVSSQNTRGSLIAHVFFNQKGVTYIIVRTYGYVTMCTCSTRTYHGAPVRTRSVCDSVRLAFSLPACLCLLVVAVLARVLHEFTRALFSSHACLCRQEWARELRARATADGTGAGDAAAAAGASWPLAPSSFLPPFTVGCPCSRYAAPRHATTPPCALTTSWTATPRNTPYLGIRTAACYVRTSSHVDGTASVLRAT